SFVAQTVSMATGAPDSSVSAATATTPVSLVKLDRSSSAQGPPSDVRPGGLDELLTRQEHAPLPALYGEHVAGETTTGDPVRAGVSEVVDGGQHVIVLFSVINPTDHNIL